MGSVAPSKAAPPQQALTGPQQDVPAPSAARRAAAPYFSRTIRVTSSALPCVASTPCLVSPQRDHQVVRLGQRFGPDRVVRPAPLLPVRHQSRVLEDLEVEGEPGLRGPERVHELANAP